MKTKTCVEEKTKSGQIPLRVHAHCTASLVPGSV